MGRCQSQDHKVIYRRKEDPEAGHARHERGWVHSNVNIALCDTALHFSPRSLCMSSSRKLLTSPAQNNTKPNSIPGDCGSTKSPIACSRAVAGSRVPTTGAPAQHPRGAIFPLGSKKRLSTMQLVTLSAPQMSSGRMMPAIFNIFQRLLHRSQRLGSHFTVISSTQRC